MQTYRTPAACLALAMAIALSGSSADARDAPPRTFALLSHAGGAERERLAEFWSETNK